MSLRQQRWAFFIAALALVVFATWYVQRAPAQRDGIPFLDEDSAWADSVLRELSETEKLAQLMTIVWDSLPPADSLGRRTAAWPAGMSPGGLIVNGSGPAALRAAAAGFQRSAALPLLIGSRHQPDADSGIALPASVSLGAIRDAALLHEAGDALGLHARSIGLQWLLLPSLESAWTPDNAEWLPARTAEVSAGLQDRFVLAAASPVSAYFPLEKDSVRREQLLRPYRLLTGSGLSGWVLGTGVWGYVHPADRAEAAVRDYARTWLGYEGLMLAPVPDSVRSVQVRVEQGLKAGADQLLVAAPHAAEAWDALQQAWRRRLISEKELNGRVRRMLLAKAWTRAPEAWRQARQPAAAARPAAPYAALNRKLERASLTLIRDSLRLTPPGRMDFRCPLVLTIGTSLPALEHQFQLYGVETFRRIAAGPRDRLPALSPELAGYDPLYIVLAGVQLDSLADEAFLRSLAALARQTPVMTLHLGDPANLPLLQGLPALMQGYSLDAGTQALAVQALMGGVSADGLLPFSQGPRLRFGTGIATQAVRLAYSPPESAGLDGSLLAQIDSVALRAIAGGAMPGCQILLAKDGQVFYHKAFGTHTYDPGSQQVAWTDLYDIASVTKAAATTLAVMKLSDFGAMEPDMTLGEIFSSYRTVDEILSRDSLMLPRAAAGADTSTRRLISSQRAGGLQISVDWIPKGADSVKILRTTYRSGVQARPAIYDLTLAELLTHHSGLPEALPIYRYLSNRRGEPPYYASRPGPAHSWPVARSLYIRPSYFSQFWADIQALPIDPEKPYRYSDVNLALLQLAADSITGVSLADFTREYFYHPMGLRRLTYQPRRFFSESQLVPTELDRGWRRQLVHGYVHDPSAAILGGVAGNAGLFSNANDLAHLFQMLLDGGSYGGVPLLSPETVSLFTRRHAGHRGYGFDLPPESGDYLLSARASQRTFGHTGFTGSCVWADPDAGLIFVFLSNRVHPSAANWKLNTWKVRQQIHDLAYQAIRIP
ncbi:MAG: serine hydrolase [Bacteroidia bacterium]|nr:serine hydrolase [Bacteroidia bacterium]